LIGTVSYLPPELVVSGRADARSDVYSTGVVLFELLTGRKPHTGETPIQVAYAHVHNDVPAPSSLPTATPIPPYLDALVARATARESSRRPADAKIFLAEFRRVYAALRQGLPDDPALTAELRGAARPHSPLSPQPWAAGGDQANHEITQLVQPVPAPPRPEVQRPSQLRGASARGSSARGSSASEPYPTTPGSPPTVRDAAPAGPPQAQLRLSAERLTMQRERASRRRRRGILILLLVFLLTTAAALTGWYLTEGRFTSAPALTAMPQSEAEALAQRQGLTLDPSPAYSETVARGTIISTEPTAGAKILDGGTITAVVSKGPERFAMPRVTGTTEAAAVAALRRLNLKPGEIDRAYSETVAVGVVLSSTAKAGAMLKRDSVVGLTVSRGPEPIKIRDFEGKSADAARQALEKAGFAVKVTTANSDTVDKGDVIGQAPRKGTGKKGDVITIERSLGPVLVKVPALRGKTTAEASRQLKALGFTVRVRPVAVNYIGAGLVVTTSPGSGASAPKGSRITVYEI
jgi:serine/threonine-protein kinase